jgi:hypothetical protein
MPECLYKVSRSQSSFYLAELYAVVHESNTYTDQYPC